MTRYTAEDKETTKRLASVISRICYAGECLIDDERATGALQRAFHHYLTQPSEPHTIKLSHEEVEGFPVKPILEDADWYLTVWIENEDARFDLRQSSSFLGEGIEHEILSRRGAVTGMLKNEQSNEKTTQNAASMNS